MSKIEINTKRLLLTPLGSKYLDTVNEYSMDNENTKYMWYLPNYTVSATKNFLKIVDLEWQKEKPEFFEFAIIYNDEHIGAVSITLQNEIGELGWIINKKYWRNGFAYEAAYAIVEYFKTNMGITHFIATCDTENIGSYKVMEKLGMIRTDEYGGRQNKLSPTTTFEYQYELILD